MTNPQAHAPTPAEFVSNDEVQVDPHGFGAGHHHGHVIVSVFTLRTVLAILLSFTVLTVFFAQGEKWAAATFDIVFPHWVNIVVAMSIATVKSVVVAAYFMQLKYDNPINAVIFLFCLFALGLFIGFTGLDVCYRDRVYPWKAGEVQVGGLGGSHITRTETTAAGPKKIAVTKNIADFVREKRLEEVGPEEFGRQEHLAHEQGHHAHAGEPLWTNETSRSRPRRGQTPGLFDATAPAHDDHAHDEHAPSHAPAPANPPGSGGH